MPEVFSELSSDEIINTIRTKYASYLSDMSRDEMYEFLLETNRFLNRRGSALQSVERSEIEGIRDGIRKEIQSHQIIHGHNRDSTSA